MLNLARSYIDMGNYSAARTKLNDLIRKHPDNPAAKDAAVLLEKIRDK